jgi:hypothetical protein
MGVLHASVQHVVGGQVGPLAAIRLEHESGIIRQTDRLFTVANAVLDATRRESAHPGGGEQHRQTRPP